MSKQTDKASGGLLTLYARREPTRDSASIWAGLSSKKDVVLYSDRECTNRKAVFGWWQSAKPHGNAKRVTLNCFNWALVWV